MFISFQKHWLYSWKLLTLISTIKRTIDWYYIIISKIKSLFTIVAEAEKKKKEKSPNMLLFWGFLVLVIVANIFFGGDGGGHSLPPGPSEIPGPLINPDDNFEDTLKKSVDNSDAEQKSNDNSDKIVFSEVDVKQMAKKLIQEIQPEIEARVREECLRYGKFSESFVQIVSKNKIMPYINREYYTGLENTVIEYKKTHNVDFVSKADLTAIIRENLFDKLIPDTVEKLLKPKAK
jgi:hypothetical protein